MAILRETMARTILQLWNSCSFCWFRAIWLRVYGFSVRVQPLSISLTDKVTIVNLRLSNVLSHHEYWLMLLGSYVFLCRLLAV